jgi:hypothetical protein
VLSKLRLALSPIRTKVQVLYGGNYDDHIASLAARERQFLESLHRYFYQSQIIPPGSEHKTAATELVIWLTKYRAELGSNNGRNRLLRTLKQGMSWIAHGRTRRSVQWRGATQRRHSAPAPSRAGLTARFAGFVA